MSVLEHADRVLSGAHLYKPARDTYHRFVNRSYHRERQQARAFFRPLMPQEAVAFDVGAHRGLRAELFLELGASKVVAVEPIPWLAERIRRHFRSKRLVIECCAIGAAPGEASLHVGFDEMHSTLSDDWMQRVHERDDIGERWHETITVPVRTLDDLAAQHGHPHFVKLDIEGNERAALDGMTFAPDALSFEFQCPALEVADVCLGRLEEVGTYQYRIAGGEQFEFLHAGWSDRKRTLERMERLRDEEPTTHGDVYAVLA